MRILSVVDERNARPLNRLWKQLPPGLLVDTRWLQARGVSRSQVHDYVRRDWLERVGPRLYRRADDVHVGVIPWEVAVVSAQQLGRASLHVGGATALSLLGLGHYLRLSGDGRVYLYDPERSAPGWLDALTLTATLMLRTKKLFAEQDLGLQWRRIDLGSGRLGAEPVNEPSSAQPWDHFLRVAGEERAVIEMMDEIPETEEFEHVDEVFQSLVNLRPSLLNALLQACTSIKAKRLFLFYADRHDHAWRRRIDRDAVNLGRGKRQLVAGGRFVPEYQITVPAALRDTSEIP